MRHEEALVLGAHGNLIGILSVPDGPPRDVAIVMLNAGLIHHVGPGRLHVDLARRLAAAGFGALRLDFSGVGDSLPRPDDLPVLELAAREPCEAIDLLAERGYRRFVLFGICSGAYAAFKAAARDPRVSGLVLVNPQEFVGDPDWGAYTWARRYWSRSIFRPRAWLNLLTGRINYRRLWRTLLRQAQGRLTGSTARTEQEAKAVETQLLGLAKERPLLFLLSDDDVSVEQLSALLGRDVRNLSGEPNLDVVLVPGADHLFTRRHDKTAISDAVESWIGRLAERTA